MEIWIDNSISINNIQYIDYNLIDQISGFNEGNKFREATKLTNHVLCGISLKAEDQVENKWPDKTQDLHRGMFLISTLSISTSIVTF